MSKQPKLTNTSKAPTVSPIQTVSIDLQKSVRTSKSDQSFNQNGSPILTDKQKEMLTILGDTLDYDGSGLCTVERVNLDECYFTVHYVDDKIDKNYIVDLKSLKKQVKQAKGTQKNVYVYENRDWELIAVLHKPEMDFNRVVSRLRLQLKSANEGGVDFETHPDYKGLNVRLKKLNIGDGITELFDVRPELLELHMTAAATIWANALFAMNYKEEEDDGAIITPQPIDSNWTEEDEATFKISYTQGYEEEGRPYVKRKER